MSERLGLGDRLDHRPDQLGLLRDVCHERRVPGLLVTHDPDAIAFVDRTVNLRDGALTEGSGANATVS
jgi:predicted ABC-type transport system involved in lysophospholipase L1 biosynthesis ATPase subunit